MLRLLLFIGLLVLTAEACLRKCGQKSPGGRSSNPSSRDSIIGKYATYKETRDWYSRLTQENPDFVSVTSIGRTYENRLQVAVRLSPYSTNRRPAIFIEGGMHAREWLSPSTANYIIWKLIDGYKRRIPEYRTALERYTFYIMSITNPDGYIFSFNSSSPKNRFWRKNRRPLPGGCVGVDLNRNWDIDFGGRGASKKPCESTYHGPKAFSEPETNNIRRYVLNTLKPIGLQLYISLHTFAQAWIVPYSYKEALPASNAELHRVAHLASAAMKKVNKKMYGVYNGAKSFEVATGGSDDWMLDKVPAKYSYTLELPPSMHDIQVKEGFVRPPSEIIPTGEEVMAGLLSLLKTMKYDT